MKFQNRKNKERLDNFLVTKGYFDTKSQAQAAIIAGKVKINNELITVQTVVNENQIDVRELDALLDQSELFLTNIEPLYLGFNTRHKRELIKLIYPKGIEYADGVLRTKERSYLFKYIEALEEIKTADVTPPGIEPGLLG